MITTATFGVAELELVRQRVRNVLRFARKVPDLPSDAAEDVESRTLLAIAEELAAEPMTPERLAKRASVHAVRALDAVKGVVMRDAELSVGPPKRDKRRRSNAPSGSLGATSGSADAGWSRLLAFGAALRANDGNVTHTAKALGISLRKTRQAIADSTELRAITDEARRRAA